MTDFENSIFPGGQTSRLFHHQRAKRTKIMKNLFSGLFQLLALGLLFVVLWMAMEFLQATIAALAVPLVIIGIILIIRWNR